jgi:hypothetical protein
MEEVLGRAPSIISVCSSCSQEEVPMCSFWLAVVVGERKFQVFFDFDLHGAR